MIRWPRSAVTVGTSAPSSAGVGRCRHRCHRRGMESSSRSPDADRHPTAGHRLPGANSRRWRSHPWRRKGKVAGPGWRAQREDRAPCEARPMASRWRSSSTTTACSPRSACAVHRGGSPRRTRCLEPRFASSIASASRSRSTASRWPRGSRTRQPSMCWRASYSSSLPATPNRMSSSMPAWCRLADRPSSSPGTRVRGRRPWSGPWWPPGRATTRMSTRFWTLPGASIPTRGVRASVRPEDPNDENPSRATAGAVRSQSEL